MSREARIIAALTKRSLISLVRYKNGVVMQTQAPFREIPQMQRALVARKTRLPPTRTFPRLLPLLHLDIQALDDPSRPNRMEIMMDLTRLWVWAAALKLA